MKSLLLKLPIYGRILLGLSAALLVCALGFYGAARYGGETVKGSPDPHEQHPFHWAAGTLMLENSERRRPATCYLRPARSTQRSITLAARDDGGSHGRKIDPWFSGSATVTCTRTVTAYTGSQIKRREFSQSPSFLVGTAVLVAAPVVAFLFIGTSRLFSRS